MRARIVIEGDGERELDVHSVNSYTNPQAANTLCSAQLTLEYFSAARPLSFVGLEGVVGPFMLAGGHAQSAREHRFIERCWCVVASTPGSDEPVHELEAWTRRSDGKGQVRMSGEARGTSTSPLAAARDKDVDETTQPGD